MGRKFIIHTFGCQMNIYDTELVNSILSDAGFEVTNDERDADIIFFNTCAVRDHAEHRVFERIKHIKALKKRKKSLVVGVLGCISTRLKEKLFERFDHLDLVVAPDNYKNLPSLINKTFVGERQISANLCRRELYEDIVPQRIAKVSAWVAIMRGCDNFCSYCVVPYTRGRERSRSKASILKEIEKCACDNYKEITLLGQNVNSYYDKASQTDFPNLLEEVARNFPDLWIRFITSHPKDLSDKLINVMAEYDNICSHLHLPVQSGSNRILELMNRKYTVEHYKMLIQKIRFAIPQCSITTDVIAGFPTERVEDHKQTIELLQEIRFDSAFMFKYSPREGTSAYKLVDDVPEEEKIRRLNEIIQVQQKISGEINQTKINEVFDILIDGRNNKNLLQVQGRTKTNKVVIIDDKKELINAGDIVKVRILRSTSATLFGEFLE